MKRITGKVALALLLAFAIAACAKQPDEEISAARTAVDTVMAEGAEKYAPHDAQKLNDALNAAMAEIKAQDGKIIKDYTQARQLLLAVKAESEALKVGLAAKKQEAMDQALAAKESALAAIDQTKALLAKAPKGKGALVNADALNAELSAVDAALQEAETLLTAEDFLAAAEKAKAAEEQAVGMSQRIAEAMGKPGGRK